MASKPRGNSLRISKPGDALEHEADRTAAQVVRGNRVASWSLSKMSDAHLQRQDSGALVKDERPKPQSEQYKEAASMLGEAFLKTDVGKKLEGAAKQAGEEFLSSLPGKIIAGAAASGAVAALAATHTPLPMQIPEIPLDKIHPGLKVKLTYEGPVDHPTKALITFSYTPGAEKRKSPLTESERYRAETARIAAEQEKFRRGMRYTPGSPQDLQQKAEEKAMQDYISHRYGTLLGFGDKPLVPPALGGAGTPETGLQLPKFESPFKPKPPTLFDEQLELKPLSSSALEPGAEKKEEPPAAVQKKCACGGSGGDHGECEECRHEKLSLQRRAAGKHEPAGVSPTISEALRSPGQPLDGATRAFFEPRFGYDFSRVRVHTDQKAAESATSVNALAYTVGRDVVFGAGHFSPSTKAGINLLAHELTHVVQQGSLDGTGQTVAEIGCRGDSYERQADQVAHQVTKSDLPLRGAEPSHSLSRRRLAVQRNDLNCYTTAVRDECNNATAKCATAADYCKGKFPTAADLDNFIANIKTNFATSDFGPNAKRNFGHWLDGTGSDLVMPTKVFEGHPGTKDALSTHRSKFLEGVQKRIADGRIKPGTLSDVIFYTGHANAFSLPPPPHSDDLAYAVGGFQLCSNVRVMVTSLGSDRYKVQFAEWKCEAFDCYNWDPGKGIGMGDFNDKTLCCVENAGKAKHFFDRTDVWDNKDPDSTADAEVTVTGAGAGSSAPPAKEAPKKKEESRF